MAAVRVLITGGSGFLGANLVRAELAAGHEVHLLLRPHCDRWRLSDLFGEYHSHRGYARDPDSLARTIRASRPEVIYHLAPHDTPYKSFPDQNEAVDPAADLNALLDTLTDLEVRAVVTAFPSLERPCAFCLANSTANTFSLRRLEPSRAASRLFEPSPLPSGRTSVSVSVYGVYGPWEDSSELASVVFHACLRGQSPHVGVAQTPRDWIYVEDVVNLLRMAANTPAATGQTLQAGTGQYQTVQDLVETILTVCSNGRLRALYGKRMAETAGAIADLETTTALTGWRPCYDLRAGVEAHWRWYTGQQRMRLVA